MAQKVKLNYFDPLSNLYQKIYHCIGIPFIFVVGRQKHRRKHAYHKRLITDT